MRIDSWIKKNCHSLKGKLIAINGATGDIGKETCFILASLGANLLLLNRNKNKSNLLKEKISERYSDIKVDELFVDLEDFSSVKEVCKKLDKYEIDILILNAGAYKIGKRKTDIGYDNVFQINFISQYYMARKVLEKMKERSSGKIVAVSSIAHNYSKINETDIDFYNNHKASKVYGNSKRFLMFSLYELFKDVKGVELAIVHPGISYTNITSHYPKLVFMLIKYPMKIIFHKPSKACLSVIQGVFDSNEYHTWIGPRIFDIWGYPRQKKLNTCSIVESKKIKEISENIYKTLN